MHIYLFKRDFYFEIKDKLNDNNIIFLLGTRKCGKTVCLKQLDHDLDNAVYVDFKTLSDMESNKVFSDILNDISRNEDKIYLLDEITYAFRPENKICEIADAIAEVDRLNTKIIFTGSQSVALESWSNRAFAGNVVKIKANFLTYSEYLRYIGTDEISEDTYNKFLYGASDFYKFVSLEDYLKGCLEETIVSNNKTSNYIYDNNCDLIDTDTLLDICYATLFTLHNHVNTQTFSKNNKILDDIKAYFSEICFEIGNDEISNRIEKSFIGRYNHFRSKDLDTLKQAFLFLYKCDLITLTPMSDDFERITDVATDLKSEDSRINYKDDMPQVLPKQLLGSIVKCHARGLLPHKGVFEYRDINDNELDFVDIINQQAIEFTVSNKRIRNTHFDVVPKDFERILLSKDKDEIVNDVKCVPYYKFIYDVSTTH